MHLEALEEVEQRNAVRLPCKVGSAFEDVYRSFLSTAHLGVVGGALLFSSVGGGGKFMLCQ
jgi:hypothetical protein